MFTTEDEWNEAARAAKDELANWYAQGLIDIPQPVDQNLSKLATLVTRRVITSTVPDETPSVELFRVS